MFLFAIAGFALSQLGCGFAGSLEAEVAWRLVQGLTGAPLVPLGQVVAVNAMPGRHTQATSLWAMGFIVANVLMGFIAVFLARTMAYLTLFPRGILGPLIIIFSIIVVVLQYFHGG